MVSANSPSYSSTAQAVQIFDRKPEKSATTCTCELVGPTLSRSNVALIRRVYTAPYRWLAKVRRVALSRTFRDDIHISDDYMRDK